MRQVYTAVEPCQDLARKYTAGEWQKSELIAARDAPESKRLVNRDALTAEPRAFCVKSDLGGRGEGFPVVWEQLLDPADRMRGDSREHVAEPGKRLDRIPLAHRDEA